MEHLGQSNVDHVNLSRLKQRVLELEQSNGILLSEKEQFLQEISRLDKNNIELSHHNDLLQMQLNEAEQRAKILSATFTATNSEMDKESQINAHLEQRVKSQQVMIAKLRKEQKQMTSTNQSLAKQLEETNAKYDKLQNEYDLVTKDDTQYINQLEYEIDELRKRITVENQRALSSLEQSSDTLPDAEDQKTEDISEGGGGVGAHFVQRTQIIPSLPSFSHRSSRSMSFRSITSNRSSFGPAFNNITSPRMRLLAGSSIHPLGKQIYQPPSNRISVNRGRIRSHSDTVDADNFEDDVDSVIYVEDRGSVRSESVIFELLGDDQLYDELQEQYDGFNENSTNPTQKHDPLQMQLNEAEIRTHALSDPFTATRSGMNKESQRNAPLEQQEMIAKLQKEQEQMKSKNQSLAKQLDETNAKYDELQNDYEMMVRDYALILENKPAVPTLEDRKTEDIPMTEFGEPIQRVQSLPLFSGSPLPTIKSNSLHSRSTTKESHEMLPQLQTYINSNGSATYGRFSGISKSNSGSITASPSSPQQLTHSKGTFENELGDSKSFRYGEYLEYWRPGHSNSVRPKHRDLREEMTKNNVVTISSKKYDELHAKAQKLAAKRPLIAKRIGNNNKMCGIEAGTAPSVEHIIALLIYTDLNYHQCEFKKQCRKSSADEPLKELIRRNREICHWCRLIKELCIFYGEVMGENDVLYSGMGEYLMFDSLCTRFECPISTSTKLDVAKRFAKGAIVLQFKRGSVNTKTLDVTKYSCFGHDESERLVAGSTLQIVDILINDQSHRRYVSALRMLEQIINGHFIDGDENNHKITSKLISLLRYAISPTLTDKLRNLNLADSFYIFLEDEGYDSDAVVEETVADTSSEICKCFGSSIFAEVQKCSYDHAATKHPEYIQEAVFCFLRKMKRLSTKGALWLNQSELSKPRYTQLHNAFVGPGGIFDYFQIAANGIRKIQTFSWENSNESCDEHQYLNRTEFRTESKEYLYEFDKMKGYVHFQLQFYRKFIGKEVECSIYVKILPKTFRIESVTTEMDIICHCDGAVHRSLMRKQKLDTDTKKGVMVFRSENVNENSSITWKFAIQMEPKQIQWRSKDRSLVWEQSLDTIDDQESDDELKEQYDVLKEWNDDLLKKHQKTLVEFDDIKMEKDEVKKLYLEKEKEIERLIERLRQKDETVQELEEKLKTLKRDNASKGFMNSIIRMAM